jgi:hypothetical protein
MIDKKKERVQSANREMQESHKSKLIEKFSKINDNNRSLSSFKEEKKR